MSDRGYRRASVWARISTMAKTSIKSATACTRIRSQNTLAGSPDSFRVFFHIVNFKLRSKTSLSDHAMDRRRRASICRKQKLCHID